MAVGVNLPGATFPEIHPASFACQTADARTHPEGSPGRVESSGGPRLGARREPSEYVMVWEYYEDMRIPMDLDRPPSLDPTAADVAARPLATWGTRRPWVMAVVVALGATALTGFGVGMSQARHLDQLASIYTQAAFVGLSAVLGLSLMRRTKPSLTDYGFRRPLHLGRVLWVLPLAAVPVVLVAFAGIRVTPAQAVAYALLAVCVGFSEEIWFRGLLLASLRRLGTRKAIIGASAIFGVLHLTNFFAGRAPLYLVLQFVFACLVGFVLAELVAITGSLWVGIVWHMVYDMAAFSTGDELTPMAVAGVAIATALLAVYAVLLWRRLPAREDRTAVLAG